MTGFLKKKIFMAAGILLVMILAVSGCDFIDSTADLDDDISESGEVELYLSESEEEEAAALNIDSDNSYPDKDLDNIKEVNVVIESILINNKDGEGWQQLDDFEEPQMVDLLDPELSSDPLVESEAAAGEYDMIKLMAAAEYDEEENNGDSDADSDEISDKSHVVYGDGEKEDLFIKAAASAGIKVHGDFTVDDESQALTLAFTADELLVERGPNEPMLVPAAFHIEAGEPEDPGVPEDPDESLEISDVEEISDINVENGTEFEELDLPEEVEVTLEDESTEMLEVNWQKGDYNGEEAVTYTIEGELVLSENIENPEEIKPAVDVTVETEDTTASVELYFSQEDDSGTASALQGPPGDNDGPQGLENVDEINVVLESIYFNNKDGSGWENLTHFEEEGGTIQVDLLDLELSSELAAAGEVESGEYEMIRLFASAEYDEDNGDEVNENDVSDKSHVVYEDEEVEELFIQAAASAGIKVHGDFAVEENEKQALTIAFAAEDLLVERGPNEPMLVPTAFHIEEGEPEDSDTGKITGSVAMADETELEDNEELDVKITVNDKDDNAGDTVATLDETSDVVTLTANTETEDYTLKDIEYGTYEVTAEIDKVGDGADTDDYEIELAEDETTEVEVDDEEVDGPDYEVVEADAETENYKVSLEVLAGAGSVDVDGETLEAEGDSVEIEAETEITISALPDEGWEFGEWTEDAAEEDEASFETTIEDDYDPGVIFEEI